MFRLNFEMRTERASWSGRLLLQRFAERLAKKWSAAPGHAEAAAEASPPSLPIDTVKAEPGRSFAAAPDDQAFPDQCWSIVMQSAVKVGCLLPNAEDERCRELASD